MSSSIAIYTMHAISNAFLHAWLHTASLSLNIMQASVCTMDLYHGYSNTLSPVYITLDPTCNKYCNLIGGLIEPL